MSKKSAVNVKMTDRVEQWPIERVAPYDRNPRTHSGRQVEQIAESIRRFGFTAPLIVDESTGTVIAGHGRLLAAQRLGLAVVPVIPVGHMSDDERRAYVIADNRLALGAGWDHELLAAELEDLKGVEFDLDVLGFEADELDTLMGGGGGIGIGIGGEDEDDDEDEGEDPDDQADAIPEKQAEAITCPGDIWILGRHRLGCLDSTVEDQVAQLLAGASVDLILTDPPYCSGGFQEMGKGAGSVGTQKKTHKQIANDRLSTRGYMSLLKTAFTLYGAPYLAAFTDWRMWVYLFDVVESSGYGVRSMIVWDKETPGLGRSWRAQHELIMWAAKQVPPWDPKDGGSGNVIRAKRSGNTHHTTEKPVDLIRQILENSKFGRTVADPFAGSGTTLIACEIMDRTFYGAELDPHYCDVAVRRWQLLTGQTAVHADSGEPFPTG